MICRTFFCEECSKLSRPHSGNYYVLYHSKKKEYSIHQLEYNPERINRGFTPHLVQVMARTKDEVLLELSCCMYSCGIDLEKKGEKFFIKIKIVRRVYMSVKDYEALLNHSDLGYRLID